MSERERGSSVAEVAIASGLLLVVMVPIMLSLTAAQRREVAAERVVRAVDDGRIALERIVRDVREADRVAVASASALELWVDDDGDSVEDAAELVTYEIDADARTLARAAGSSYVLARGIGATSAFEATDEVAGALVAVTLEIDPDPSEPPGSTVLRTEVLARNA